MNRNRIELLFLSWRYSLAFFNSVKLLELKNGTFLSSSLLHFTGEEDWICSAVRDSQRISSFLKDSLLILVYEPHSVTWRKEKDSFIRPHSSPLSLWFEPLSLVRLVNSVSQLSLLSLSPIDEGTVNEENEKLTLELLCSFSFLFLLSPLNQYDMTLCSYCSFTRL